MNYIDIENFKLVEKLEITDMMGNIIESISYALCSADTAYKTTIDGGQGFH